MIRFISNKIAKIIGGAIDNTVIGGTTPAPGSFTNITSTQDTVLGGSSTDGNRLRVTKDSANTDVKIDSTTSGRTSLFVEGYNTNTTLSYASGGGNLSLKNLSGVNNNYSTVRSLDSGGSALGAINFINVSHINNIGEMAFLTRPSGGSLSEAGRFDATGHLLVGTTDNTPYNNSTSAGTGTSIGPNGQIWNHAHNGDLGTWNRTGSDGSVFLINRDGSTVATVSVASGTVTWGTFCGGHNSQFADNSQPEIERGTVISSIDELVEWKTVRWTQTVTEAREIDGELQQVEIDLPKQADYYGAEPVGAVFTDDDGNEKTVHAKQADQLPKCEVSTTEGDKMVYGTFSHYDENGTPIIHSLGQTVVKVTGPIEAGDLLMSKGDGTACKWVESYGYAAILGKCRQGAPSAAQNDVNLLAYTSMAG